MRAIRTLLLGAALLGCGGGDDDGNSPAQAGSVTPAVAGASTIYLHETYTLGVGGFMTVEYRPYLVFADGRLYKNLATNPDKLDPAASRAAEPDEWGTFTKNGDAIAVTWSDGETEQWEKDEWFTTNPAPAGTVLAGEFTSISGGGNVAFGGDVVTYSSANIAFQGDKFTMETSGGGSTEDVTAYADRERAGTYVLDGYTIELRFNSGVVEKKFFYFYPDSRDVFGVGDRYYVTAD